MSTHDPVREALAELVRLRDLQQAMHATDSPEEHERLYREGFNGMPAAWAAASAALSVQPAPSGQAVREDGMPASASERHLRRLLAGRVNMPHAYYDDGEAQGMEHGISIDFMREPVADIAAKLRALGVARYECELVAAPSPTPQEPTP